MGFSIGKFIGSIAPVLGTALGGPLGGALGLGISAGFAPSPAPAPAPIPARAVTPQGPQFQPSQFTSVSPVANPFNVQRRRVAFLPAARIAAPAAAGLGGAVMGAIFGTGEESVGDILRQARESFGRGVTKNKIINAAKFCGIESAAETFGLAPTQLCKIIVSGRSRRRRGISAADIRRTRRTLRTVKSIRADLKSIRL